MPHFDTLPLMIDSDIGRKACRSHPGDGLETPPDNTRLSKVYGRSKRNHTVSSKYQPRESFVPNSKPFGLTDPISDHPVHLTNSCPSPILLQTEA